MNEENNSQESGKSGLQIGAEAARAAKTMSKAASRAAAQDYTGAALELLKDENTRRAVIAIILIPVILIAIIGTLFLYALPTMMWETVQTFFAKIQEGYLEDLYSGQYGNTLQSFFPALRNSAGEVLSSFASSLWNGFKGLFSGEGDGDNSSTEDLNLLSDTGQELLVVQSEEAQKETLEAKVQATQDKFDARMTEIEEVIIESNVIASAVYCEWDNDYGGENETVEYAAGTGPFSAYTSRSYKVQYRHLWDGCTVSCMKATPSKLSCVKIMSAYTAITGASISDMRISDYMKWLGYEPGYLFPGLARNNYSVFSNGLVVNDIPKWQGTCLPQYLYEQKEYEVFHYGSPLLDYEEDYGSAVVDLLCVVNLPSVAGIEPTSITEYWYESDPYYTWIRHDPTEEEYEAAAEAGEPAPETWWEQISHKRFVVEYCYEYSAAFSMGIRNADVLVDILGITGSEESSYG